MGQNSQIKRSIKKRKEAAIKSAKIAKENYQKTLTPNIYLDESGNTGHNIIDLDQPIFTLAGTLHTKLESERLLSLLNCNSPIEAHFKKLRKTKSGQEGIIRLLENRLINSDLVRVELINKDYMITGKIVDILIESSMHFEGHDLYIDGKNIALTNMWHICMPYFCGQSNVHTMKTAFIEMIRKQGTTEINSFYDCIEQMKHACSDEKFKSSIDLITSTKKHIARILKTIDKSALDPSIPALFNQCVLWGNIYPKGIKLIHDDSKPVEQQQEFLKLFMNLTKKEIEIGYDRRKFKLPLKVLSLSFSSSHLHPQIQVADIISSSIAYWASCKNRQSTDDIFFKSLDRLNLEKLLSPHCLWPTDSVTPESLNTEFSGGLNPADHAASFISTQVN